MHLNWVKMIKSFHGDVEQSALNEVETIMSSGILEVGAIKSGKHKVWFLYKSAMYFCTYHYNMNDSRRMTY